MFKKTLALLGALALSVAANAAPINISGTITGGSGALVSLVPVGTAFTGTLDWDAGNLVGGQVLLGGFCFTDDASGLPPTSPTCGARSAVPLLNTGSPPYTGANQAGPYQQAGTTFNGNGTSGLLKIAAFSPTFGVAIPITLNFTSAAGGTLLADAGGLGTSAGNFTVLNPVPVPAAAWLFGSALFGLAGIARRKAKA